MFLFYDKLHCGWRKGNAPVVRLHEYPENSVLCAARCLDEYLDRSFKANLGDLSVNNVLCGSSWSIEST